MILKRHIISDRLFANEYTMIESNVDWNPNVFSSMKDMCGLSVKSQPLSEMGCLSECFFQLSPTCHFFFVVDSVCYFGNFNHSTGHEAIGQYKKPSKVFVRRDLVNLTDYILRENRPKATYATKIFAVVNLSFGIDACKYHCFLFNVNPCDFYVIFDNKCWLGNQSDPTNYTLANNLPDTIHVYSPPDPPLSKLVKSLGFNFADDYIKNHRTNAMLPQCNTEPISTSQQMVLIT